MPAWRDVILTGDWHLGRSNEHDARCEAYAHALESQYPEARLVILGDAGNESLRELMERFLFLVGYWMQKGRLELVPGNHDRAGSLGSRVRDGAVQDWNEVFGEKWSDNARVALSWGTANARERPLVLVDSTRHETGLDEAIEHAAEGVLSAHTAALVTAFAAPYAIVCMHHNPFDVRKFMELLGAENALGCWQGRMGAVAYGHSGVYGIDTQVPWGAQGTTRWICCDESVERGTAILIPGAQHTPTPQLISVLP